MTDKELLILAANAAGVDVPPDNAWGGVNEEYGVYKLNIDGSKFESKWNPLTDDGDAFRLAVRLGLTISPASASSGFAAISDNDRIAAARRAVVMSAASIETRG